MKLFKMLGQIFTEEQLPSSTIISSNSSNDKLKSTGNRLHNLINNHNNKYTTKEVSTLPKLDHNESMLSNDSEFKNDKLDSCYVLYSPNGQTVLVIHNKIKKEFLLEGIQHSNKAHPIAKEASSYINDLVKKKKVYFELGSNNHYIFYLDKDKKTCLNNLLIKKNLHNSDTLENLVIPETVDSSKPLATTVTPQVNLAEKPKSDLPNGIFVKGQSAPYLFNKENSNSYGVTILHNEKEETHWGIDLKRAIEEKNVQQGDYITLENLGQQDVSIDVPIKDIQKKIIGYEKKLVKRNTWSVNILTKFINQDTTPALKKQDPAMNQHSNNAYSLFATSYNTFTCMYKNQKQNYTLDNIFNDSLTDKDQKAAQIYLNKLISKKVIYLEVNPSNNFVTIFANKNDNDSINSNILQFINSNKENKDKVLLDKPIIAVKSSVKNQIIAPPKLVKVEVAPIKSEFEAMDDDFFSGFGLGEPAPSNIVNEPAHISKPSPILPIEQEQSLNDIPPIPDDFLLNFEYDNSNNSNDIPEFFDNWGNDNLPEHVESIEVYSEVAQIESVNLPPPVKKLAFGKKRI